MAQSEREFILSHDVDAGNEVNGIIKEMKETYTNKGLTLKNLSWGIVAACIGHTLEWFDWALFALLADEIGVNFFPSHHHIFETLSTFAVFGCAFLMRPIGGSLLGAIGDKYGRVTALRISIYFMAISSLLTGILPNYHVFGAMSPILLTIFRLIQGLSVGGEGTGAVTYIIEIAPNNKLAFYVSLLSLAGCGFIFASLFVGLLRYVYSAEQMISFAWRIPFIFGALVGVVGIWLRKGLKGSTVFLAAKREGRIKRNPLRESFRQEKMNALIIVCHLAYGAAKGYAIFTWVPSYVLTKEVNPIRNIYLINSVALVVAKTSVIMSALFVDKYLSSDPTFPLIVFGSLSSVFLLFFFEFLPIMNTMQILFCEICFGALDGVYMIGYNLWAILRLKDTATRYSTYGFSYNMSLALFGGSAPFLSSLILLKSGTFGIGAYLASLGMLSVGTNALRYYIERTQMVTSNVHHIEMLNVVKHLNIDENGLNIALQNEEAVVEHRKLEGYHCNELNVDDETTIVND